MNALDQVFEEGTFAVANPTSSDLGGIRVGDWSVYPPLGQLERNGETVHIEPRAMEVLVYLATRAGAIVSLDELIRSVWRGRVVGDASVYQIINQLRHALGDDRKNVRFIQTIPKHGYRLVAAVTTLDPEAKKNASDVVGIPFRVLGTAALVLLVFLVGFLLFRSSFEDQSGVPPSSIAVLPFSNESAMEKENIDFTNGISSYPDSVGAPESEVLPKSLAVLPFENLSPNPDDSYFAAGIHEEVLNQLVKLSDLNVIARASVQKYADGETAIRDIARELNVQTVMKGSVRYADDRVRITVQLIDPDSGMHLWSEVYEREFADVFTIQVAIAENIANSLQAEFSPSAREIIGKIPTQSPAAYALYLRSLRHYFPEAIEFLDRAIALDPEFALAHAAKSLASLYYFYTGPGANAAPAQAVGIERIIRDSAETALMLDPNVGLAHAALGALHQFNWRAVEAEMAFRRAIELSPNNVDVLVLYGRFERYRGEYEKSIQLTRRAIELDPNNMFTFGQLALTHRDAANWDEATEACRRFLAENPLAVGCHLVVAQMEAVRGNSAKAVAALELIEKLEPTPFRLAQIAHVYSLVGQPGEARRVFAALQDAALEEPVGEAIWSQANLAIGNYDQALTHLERAVADRFSTGFLTLTGLVANPCGDPQLASPRFRTLLDGLWNDE